MKKRGFTLVELLAVIAILAILVIIALPNVLSLFNQAKKDTFQTEVRELYRGVQQQYVLNAGQPVEFGTQGACTQADMSGNKNMKYYVSIDATGNVTEFHATNGAYKFDFTYADTELSIEDIVVSEGDNTAELDTCD